MTEDPLAEAMTWLGQQPDTLFLGQGVGCAGTKMSASFEGVPAEKRLEMPVAENFQLGISIGLSLEGFVPVSVFPRLNFLLCAMDQLINHLDKLPLYSGYRPKVIIRTAVGNRQPLDAGPQHTGDFTRHVARMLSTMQVCQMLSNGKVLDFKRGWMSKVSPLEVYQAAYECKDSKLIVEG